ncbi:hypothetical protein SAMN02745146_1912 [Hymenobacter daecheongensis DSM 21074]|uniref:UPF0323 domain-containing protein n=1 Tax=Hymenobacter daecheongensis DSM 21074 TaxID=1121955 RepID=A0A1M6F2H5_9BACT|nr:hypothetical protein [Hymenobacter daecheongensis]SHI91871.1 hypothetical protein SAMN02745146_1912 [Hymenobacter daecheongensis DSM 21074]
MNKKYYMLGDWRRNLLLAAAATSLGLALPACTSDSDRATNGTNDSADQEWTSGNGESYSQGVITEMTETQPGQWKITAEKPAGKEEVAAILHHFDGKTDTLQGAALQQQMQNYSRQHPENRVAGTGMMDVLMWSGIGYMAGRFLMPNAGYYANPGIMQRTGAWRQGVDRERQQGRGFFGRGFTGPRTSPTAGIRPAAAVSRAAVRSSAPRFGRSSGFGSRSGGGGRGFGG